MSASAIALSTLLPRSAAAQTHNWTGATNSDWTTATNWNTGTVPGAGSSVGITNAPPAVLGVSGPVTATTTSLVIASGVGSTGNLTIQNGSTLTSSGATLRIGQGGIGVVTVTGAGSRWTISGSQMIVGLGGNGTLNVENGATVVAQNGLRLANNAGSSGTLNVTNGSLETIGITAGTGTRQISFDNATVRALANSANFFGATGNQVNLAAGGLMLDTNGFDIGSLGLSGVGGLTLVGAGTLTFRAGGNFTGETVIQQGTLALGGPAGSAALALANSSRVVANATLDISGISPTAARIRNLAGTGSVTLGAKDLMITNANDTFAGVINGTGGLTVTGGTQALSGIQNYSGATTISGGTLALTGAGSIAGSSRVIANGTFSIAGLSGAGTSIQRLSGTGAVDLGTRTLTLTNANDTFAGVIGGTGGLTITGGTQALSGVNTYAGETLVSGGTVALTGAGSIGNSSRVVANSTFDVSGLTGGGTNIQSLAGSGTVALGARTLTLTNAADTFAGTFGGTGGLVVAAGAQTLTGNSATFTGTTTVAGGLLSVNGQLGGTLNVSSAGRLQGIGGVGATTNAGVIAPGNSIGTLTVAGNYTGNGGTLEIETVLGDDTSPTDRLVVTGDTAGSTTVRVLNRGGLGAQTVNGIRIVDVGGASNGNFNLVGDYVLQGRPVIVAGAYGYALYQNGVTTPTDGDWYLRSSLTNPPAPATDGSPPPPATSPTPLYQPGVPLYANYGQVLLGMSQAPSLQERVGNRYWSGSESMARAGVNTGAQTDGSWTQSAFWGRVEGGQARMSPSNTAASSYRADQFKVQTGIDGLALDGDRGRLIVGLTAQFGSTNARVSSLNGNGRIRAEGAGAGAAATWYGHDGFYVDGQAQAMFYRGDLSSDIVGNMAHGNEGRGYTVSAESGKRFGIGNGFLLTPQAQLAYAKVDFDSFTDRFGARVSLDNADSLLGRLGLALNYQNIWNDGSGIVRSDIYAIGDLHYEFLDGIKTDVAGISFASANDRLWGSIGGGGSYSWANGRYAVFGEATYRASLRDAGESHGYKGTAGFRVVW